MHDAALMFDNLVHDTFVEIIGTNIPVDSAAWDAMRFPLRHGGFGLTSMLRISHAAYFASQIQVLQNGMLDGKFGQRVADLFAPIYGNLGQSEAAVGTIEHHVHTSWQFLHNTYGGSGFSSWDFLPCYSQCTLLRLTSRRPGRSSVSFPLPSHTLEGSDR